MFVPIWIIFIFLGFIHASVFALNRNDIFEWNADPNGRDSLEEKRKLLKDAPFFWKFEHCIHIFAGIFLGWVLLWILIDKRVDLFGKQNFSDLNLVDLTLFLLGWIGINGRLPSIAHSIVDFMKSGPR